MIGILNRFEGQHRLNARSSEISQVAEPGNGSLNLLLPRYNSSAPKLLNNTAGRSPSNGYAGAGVAVLMTYKFALEELSARSNSPSSGIPVVAVTCERRNFLPLCRDTQPVFQNLIVKLYDRSWY